MQFADHSNQYIDFHKPWSMAKSEDINTQNQVQEICTVALNDFRLMSLYLKPVLPKITQDIESFLNIPELNWEDNKNILLNTLQDFSGSNINSGNHVASYNFIRNTKYGNEVEELRHQIR